MEPTKAENCLSRMMIESIEVCGSTKTFKGGVYAGLTVIRTKPPTKPANTWLTFEGEQKLGFPTKRQ